MISLNSSFMISIFQVFCQIIKMSLKVLYVWIFIKCLVLSSFCSADYKYLFMYHIMNLRSSYLNKNILALIKYSFILINSNIVT